MNYIICMGPWLNECHHSHFSVRNAEFYQRFTEHTCCINCRLPFFGMTRHDNLPDCVLCFSKEDVEKCKQKDLLEQTMSEMIGEFPALHQTIVAERDIYLTHTLRQATRCVEAPPNAESMHYTPR